MREEARRWQRYGGRPLPGGERRFTASRAPWARANLRAKWALVDRDGVNQYPSHLMNKRKEIQAPFYTFCRYTNHY